MSISISQVIPPPLLPLITISLFSTTVVLFCFSNKFISTRFLVQVIHNICFLLSDLLYFLYDSIYAHLCLCRWYYFSHFYGWVIFHCIYVPHLLHPFLCHGHLGCFYILAVVPCDAMNSGYRNPFKFWFPLSCTPSSGIAGLYSSSMFSFLRTFILFSIVTVPV